MAGPERKRQAGGDAKSGSSEPDEAPPRDKFRRVTVSGTRISTIFRYFADHYRLTGPYGEQAQYPTVASRGGGSGRFRSDQPVLFRSAVQRTDAAPRRCSAVQGLVGGYHAAPREIRRGPAVGRQHVRGYAGLLDQRAVQGDRHQDAVESLLLSRPARRADLHRHGGFLFHAAVHAVQPVDRDRSVAGLRLFDLFLHYHRGGACDQDDGAGFRSDAVRGSVVRVPAQHVGRRGADGRLRVDRDRREPSADHLLFPVHTGRVLDQRARVGRACESAAPVRQDDRTAGPGRRIGCRQQCRHALLHQFPFGRDDARRQRAARSPYGREAAGARHRVCDGLELRARRDVQSAYSQSVRRLVRGRIFRGRSGGRRARQVQCAASSSASARLLGPPARNVRSGLCGRCGVAARRAGTVRAARSVEMVGGRGRAARRAAVVGQPFHGADRAVLPSFPDVQ